MYHMFDIPRARSVYVDRIGFVIMEAQGHNYIIHAIKYISNSNMWLAKLISKII